MAELNVRFTLPIHSYKYMTSLVDYTTTANHLLIDISIFYNIYNNNNNMIMNNHKSLLINFRSSLRLLPRVDRLQQAFYHLYDIRCKPTKTQGLMSDENHTTIRKHTLSRLILGFPKKKRTASRIQSLK